LCLAGDQGKQGCLKPSWPIPTAENEPQERVGGCVSQMGTPQGTWPAAWPGSHDPRPLQGSRPLTLLRLRPCWQLHGENCSGSRHLICVISHLCRHHPRTLVESTSRLPELNISQGACKQQDQHRQPAQEPTWSRRSAPSLIPSWSSSVPSMRKVSSIPSAWLC